MTVDLDKKQLRAIRNLLNATVEDVEGLEVIIDLRNTSICPLTEVKKLSEAASASLHTKVGALSTILKMYDSQ